MHRFPSAIPVAHLSLGCCVALFTMTTPSMCAQTTSEKYDNAEARQFILKAEQAAAKIMDKANKASALEDIGIVKALAGDYEGARLIAQPLESAESKAKILQKIAFRQIISGEWDDGNKTIDGMATMDDKAQAYDSIVDELVKMKRSLEALRLVHTAFQMKLPSDSKGVFDLIMLCKALAKAR